MRRPPESLLLILKVLILAGLIVSTGFLFSPASATGNTAGCELCDCVDEFSYCKECNDGNGECSLYDCDGTLCKYQYGCPDEEPEWLDECELT